ncbi:MAG: AraC family transcriptional regulator [Segetibacter sp.]|nr:AraC family transcriptional regulator [Segetibacter sp.]
MLTSYSIVPHTVLNDFIHKYTLCKSQTANINMTFPLYATHETFLGFFIGNTSIQITNPNIENETARTGKLFLFGLSTDYMGLMTSQGNYHTFTIEFKPNGFHKVFGIRASEICNNTFTAGEVIGNRVELFYEQLVNASGIQEMVLFADAFLIGFLNKQKRTYLNDDIVKVSSYLPNKNTTNIRQCAYQANMSMRNYERRFAEQVGTSPKIYFRLNRFHAALKFKMTHPERNWTDVAYEFGYYDSMHMIKEFKQFSNSSPTALFNENPGFSNGSCYKVFATQ